MGGWELLDRIGEAARTARQTISPWQYLSATDIASMAPGGGIVNAWQDSGKGWQNLKAGNYGQAAIDYGNMGLNLAGEVPGMAMAAMAGKKAAQGIRAFHGSPHDFERFDLSKIGTGEGAQAYGHGLYFAENEGVAKAYRDTLGAQYRADNKLDQRIANNEAFAADLRKQLEGLDPASPDAAKLAQRIEFFDNANRQLKDSLNGRMYEVEINADPAHFLDWDKPLTQQSPQVRDTLAGLGIEAGDSGQQIVQALGHQKADSPAWWPGSAQEAGSAALKEAGIPGIKYLDAGSRGAGDGSRNYVVFDDKLVSILRKYGWVPGMAIPAAAMMEYSGEGAPPHG